MKKALSLLFGFVLLLGMMSQFTLPARAAEPEVNKWEGKKVSILSHSASTYAGVSNNTTVNSTIGDNDVYYTEGRHGVYQKDTWWQQVIDALGAELLVNNSWSGSCVFMPRKGAASVGHGDRAVNLHNDHIGEEPDVILVYLGCNDFAYYKDTFGKVTDVDYAALIQDNGDGTFSYATPQTTCEAYVIMLHKVQSRYPNAEVYCMTSTARRETDYTGDSYPDAGQPTEYNAQLQQIATHFGYPVIDLEKAIPKEVAVFDKYMGDKRAHPNALGMDQITNKVLSVMLGRDAEICHVTSEDGTVQEQAVLLGSSYCTDIELQEGCAVVVTMDGEDITAGVYSDGKISIDEVTGDIAIYTTIQRDTLNFRWEIQNDGLVSIGDTNNVLSKLAGTITDGVLDNTRYQLATSVVLKHNLPWALEWQCSEDWRGVVLSSDPAQKPAGMYYLCRTNGGQLCFGTWTETQYNNYGVDLSYLDSQTHTYRLVNRIAADGSNMVWLYVDEVEIGPMNNYHIGSNSQSSTSDWLSGKDFIFPYIGMEGHALRNCQLDYLQIQECTHTYELIVTVPTCTEQGGTTYTCTACGDFYRTPWLDKTAYKGKTIACVGDSITAAYGVTKDETDYVTLLAQQLGMNYTRLGDSGTTLCTDGSRTCNIRRLTEADLRGADVVTIAMGINDFCNAAGSYYKLGDIHSTDTSTIYGAARMWCERIAELRKTDSLSNTQFYFVTPVITSWNNSVTSARDWDQSKTNIHGYTLRDLCNAIIEIAALYEVSVIDLNLLSGMYYVDAKDNNITVFGGDGVHPGVKGHEMMASALANALLQNYSRDDHTHTFGSWITTTWPSCDTGEQQRVCSICSAVERRTLVSDVPHSYTLTVTAPTCTEQGYTTYICSVCGDSYVDNYTDAAGHSYVNGVCTACGTAHSNLANYEGKVISILGDSISTFAGYIPTADGFNLEHLARYPQDNLLTDVNETWWMQVISTVGAKIGINDSWRGATVSGAKPVTTGSTGENTAMGNLQRIRNLGANGTPDVILFYGGTNDLAHVSKVGTFDAANAPAEVDLRATKWDNLADGYVHTLLRLKYFYPDAQIIAMLPTYTNGYYSNEKLSEGNAVLAAICEHYGVTYVDLRECGISTANLPDNIHPDGTGMDYITAAVVEALLNEGEVGAGENVVHVVTHKLSNAESSMGYYKGVTHGKSFEAHIAGEDVKVTVTMGGADITDTVYSNSVIAIAEVTGDIVISAEGRAKLVYEDHLQQLPESICSGTNLWAVLEHDEQYYTATGWGIHSSGTVYSVTFPVGAGDCIYATSFGAAGKNGSNINGIRVTWFDANGVLESMSADAVYAEFSANGYLTVPEGAAVVSVPMWKVDNDNELYILNREHSYTSTITAPTCTERGYTTYTCVCGDSYVDDYLDGLEHDYSGTTCTVCGAVHPNAASYKGKVISILSASTSTFAGYIPVADGFNLAHRARYPQDNLLTDVNDTWWMQTIAALEAKLGINESWAGSQILNMQDTNSGDLGPDAAMASLTRIQNLGANGTPDVIFFFGGGNDMGRGVTLGSFDPESAPTEVDLTTTKWSSFADAYVAAIMRLQHFYPESEIVVMTTYAMPSYVTGGKLDKYGPIIKAICEHYGVKCIDLRDCGVTFDMLPDGIHPNAEGMDYITADVLETLLANVDMVPGENVVYSVSHELTNASASLGYYKGVSTGESFAETIGGENVSVRVTMGGTDITTDCYDGGKIAISSVTGDVVIIAKGTYNFDGHLQQLPDSFCAGTNLWTSLEPENIYYTASGWGNTSAGTSWSITFPVEAGARIWATSLGAYPDNGSTANGVRVTWFDENGLLKTVSRDVVYTEFAANGYLTAPEGAVALNLPMTNNRADYEVYILSAEHNYTSVIAAPTCTERGYTTHTCASCGDSYVDSYAEPAGHSLGEWVEVTTPTCDAEGQDKRECAVCGDVQYRDTRISGDPNKILVSNPVSKDFFEGKIIMAIGDSLTVGTGVTAEERYHYITAQALGMTNINSGTSGAVLCPGGHLPNKFETLMTAEILTKRNVDAVTIFLGINDWDNGVVNGTYQGKPKYDENQTYYDLGQFGTDDTTTIYGAAKMWCERILALQETEGCEHIQFVFITPVITSYNKSVTYQKDWNQDKVNIFGYTLRQYCTAIMEVCTYYGVPVLDQNIYSGMYYHSEDDNNVDYFGGDGIHPGPNGHAMMADALTEFLMEGYTYEERTIADCGHSYEAAVTAPTCTEDGYTTYRCPKCHYSYVGSHVDALEHNYSAGLCTVCGEDTVSVSLEGSILTLTGEFAEGTRMIVAGYDGDGRLIESRFYIWQGNPITEEVSNAETVELFFVDNNWSPLRQLIHLR